ncbi:MAG TPA: sugar phosphate nucleotidyltransferase, partial [Bryobacteraceae bacterium]|nr:sugar phosphate nucleotidyltransferase [Bryobacteraceae bacterium]
FLWHQLRLLRSRGLQRVVLCVGYLGEMIVEQFGDGSEAGVHIDYSFDGPVLLGTAGALRHALPLLGESFFVMYGDSYLDCDYEAVAATFRASGKTALMTVYRNEGRYDASNVEYRDGVILRYDKRNPTPEMKYIDYGLGVFRREPFVELPDNEPHDLAVVYQSLLHRGRLAGYEVASRFYEIGSPEGLEQTRRYLTETSSGQHSPSAV